jgi:hypothetical protein
MEDKDVKYKQVLNKLKKAEPILDDAEALVDRIMQSVAQTSACGGRIRLMRILGNISGIAASALICLFAYETLKYPASTAEKFSCVHPVTANRSVYSYKLSELNDKEKTEIIENIIKKREIQRLRKERLSAAFIAGNKEVKYY